MSLLLQFLLYNVLPSVVTGLLVLGIVVIGIRVFGIRHGSLRACLLTAPIIKSSLVLVGLTLFISWPRDLFLDLQRAAVPPETALPLFLAAGGVALMARWIVRRRGRALVLAGATPADHEARLTHALDRVMTAYHVNDASVDRLCLCGSPPPRPRLMTTDRPLTSPVAVTTGAPTIIIPRSLLAELDDEEIQGALAHEMAHFRLQRPTYCSSELFRALSVLNPLSVVLADYFHREEEQACDDIAVAAVGEPTVYAQMLLKSYRFARRQAQPLASPLVVVSQLLGRKPAVSERIERLLGQRSRRARLPWQYAGTVALWSLIACTFLMS